MANRGAHGAIHVDLPSFNPFASDEPRSGGARPSRSRSDDEAPVPVSDDRGITVLPAGNPFGCEPERVIRRGDDPGHQGLRPGGGRRQASRVPSEDEGSDNGMTTLPSHNPFGPAPEPGGHRGAQRPTRASVRRHRSPSVSEDPGDEPGTTVLPSHNPFGPDPGKRSSNGLSKVHDGSASEEERAPAPRRAATKPARAKTPVESEQESVYEEPVPRSRRKSQPKQEEPLFAGEGDERMVISYVGGIPTARPAGIKPKPGRRPAPLTQTQASSLATTRTDTILVPTDTATTMTLTTVIATATTTTDTIIQTHSGTLPSQAHHEFGRPLYANIPQLPSLVDQVKETYPSLPVAPTALLAELQARKKSPLVIPPVVPAAPMTPEVFMGKLTSMVTDVATILPDLEPKIFKMEYAEHILRKLTDTVQVRFAERQGSEIVNRVHVVPRGRLALGIMSATKPKIDVDLVIPSDFILRRWNVQSSDGPTTIAAALGLDPASIARGELDSAKLESVLTAIWEQLEGEADGFIFPGGRAEGNKYLPHWCDRHKASKGGNRLRLMASGVGVNVFIKVAVSLYGQDVIVGVDQSSAKIEDKYQLIKVYRTPGVPLSEAPLSHTHRTAAYLIHWILESPPIPLPPPPFPTSIPIPRSHIYLAINAMQRLNPTDSLYLSPNSTSRLSSLEVLTTVAKIFTFLSKAYALPLALTGRYPFILASCTTMDAMLTRLNPGLVVTVGTALGLVIPFIEGFLGGPKAALDAVKGAGASVSTVPGAGVAGSSTSAPGNGHSGPVKGGDAKNGDVGGVTAAGNGADADNVAPETTEEQDDVEPAAATIEGAEDGGVITAEPEQQPEEPKNSELKPLSTKGGRTSRTTTPTPNTSRTITGMTPNSSRPGTDQPRKPSRMLSQMGTPSRQTSRQSTAK